MASIHKGSTRFSVTRTAGSRLDLLHSLSFEASLSLSLPPSPSPLPLGLSSSLAPIASLASSQHGSFRLNGIKYHCAPHFPGQKLPGFLWPSLRGPRALLLPRRLDQQVAKSGLKGRGMTLDLSVRGQHARMDGQGRVEGVRLWTLASKDGFGDQTTWTGLVTGLGKGLWPFSFGISRLKSIRTAQNVSTFPAQPLRGFFAKVLLPFEMLRCLKWNCVPVFHTDVRNLPAESNGETFLFLTRQGKLILNGLVHVRSMIGWSRLPVTLQPELLCSA